MAISWAREKGMGFGRDDFYVRIMEYNGRIVCAESQSTHAAGHPQPQDLIGKLLVYIDNSGSNLVWNYTTPHDNVFGCVAWVPVDTSCPCLDRPSVCWICVWQPLTHALSLCLRVSKRRHCNESWGAARHAWHQEGSSCNAATHDVCQAGDWAWAHKG